MSKVKPKISDLNISDEYKKVLAFLVKPHTIAQACALIDCSYSTMSHLLLIWEAKGWVRKIPMRQKGYLFVLNTENVRL